jgi:hypothetical protein
MKDFYDLIFIADNHKFDNKILKEAIITTFKNRGTDLNARHTIFKPEFGKDPQKQKYWTSFLERNKLTSEKVFAEVVTKIKNFIEPLFS